MNEQMIQGNIVIPLLPKPENQLNPLFPTHLIIEGFGGTSTEKRLNQENVLVDTPCMFIYYTLCVREMLPQTQYFPERFSQIALCGPSEALAIPIDFIPIISSTKRVKENIQLVNILLSQLEYSGKLSVVNNQLEVDEEYINYIIQQKG